MKITKIIPKIFLALAFIFVGFLMIQPEKTLNRANGEIDLSQSGLTALLSPSLLDNKAKDKTDWFANIIPEAQAAAPFDALDNRKFTVYGGVITVVNGTATATNALEIGKAYNDGIGLVSTGKIYFDSNLSIGTAASKKTICWNDDCKTDWPGGAGGLSGSGTANKLPRWTAIEALGDSAIWQNGNNIGVDQQYPAAKFVVNNPTTALKVGSSGDAIYAYANSANAAISADQAGSGYAGYFSGDVMLHKADGTANTTNFELRNVLARINTTNSPADLANKISLNVRGNGDEDPYANLGDEGVVIKATLETTSVNDQVRGAAIWGEVNNTSATNSGPLYGGYFKCTGSYSNWNKCYAGYFEGFVEINNSVDNYTVGNNSIGLKIVNDASVKSVGLDIELATDHDTGEPPSPPYPESNENLGWTQGPIYGLKIKTGNPANQAGATLENFGIYVKPGFAASPDGGAGTTYGLYVDADPTNSIQFPFAQTVYAGYFKGNVEVTGDLTQAGSKVLDRSCFLKSNEYGAMQNPCPLDCGVGNTAVSKVNVSSYDNWTCVGICCPD